MSKLLISESPLTFQPSLAVAIGLNEAIVLQQIHYWINNSKNKGYEQDGYKWVYNTYAEWKETNFPFWSENTIQRVFASLEEKGLVISIQPMKGKYDRTKYYRIDHTKLCAFDDPKMEVIDDPKLVCSLSESENTAENTQIEKQIPQNMPLDWYIQHDLPIPEGLTDGAKAETEAVNEFESALGLTTHWNEWDGIKPEWQALKRFIIARHKEDAQAFRKYALWYKGEGKFSGGLNAMQIRKQPHLFTTAWDLFKSGQDAPQEENRASMIRTI